MIVTISSELLWLIWRVQLFSKPQQTHAPRTIREPAFQVKLPPASKLRMALAAVTRTIASQSVREMTSRNTTRAMIEVATISKLFSSDTLAEVVRATPAISRMGAAISSTTIAAV